MYINMLYGKVGDFSRGGLEGSFLIATTPRYREERYSISWTAPLFQIQPILKERKLDPNNTRREETTLTRVSIGHTRLTRSFILNEEPLPKCSCGNQYSIKHILIECTKLNHTTKKFYKANSMKELFFKKLLSKT